MDLRKIMQLTQALLHREEKWCKGEQMRMHPEHGTQYCLIGGLCQFTICNMDDRDFVEAIVAEVILEEFPRRIFLHYEEAHAAQEEIRMGNWEGVDRIITTFNDHMATTFEDLRHVLNKANQAAHYEEMSRHE